MAGGRSRPVLVGFAAETDDLVNRAIAKLARKRVDFLVANDVSRTDAGFEVDTNAAVLVDAHSTTDLPLQSKRDMARVIVDQLAARLGDAATVAPAVIDDPA